MAYWAARNAPPEERRTVALGFAVLDSGQTSSGTTPAHGRGEPPTTDEQIREAEAALSVIFPPEMLEVYRRYNGQTGISAPLTGTWKLLRLKTAIKQWQIQKKLMAGDLQCVGQVVLYWHDREVRECAASHIVEWLEQLANDMEGGKYIVEE